MKEERLGEAGHCTICMKGGQGKQGQGKQGATQVERGQEKQGAMPNE